MVVRRFSESRLFPATTILLLVVLLAALPNRYRVFPQWILVLSGVVLAIVLLAAGFAPASRARTRVERYAVTIYAGSAICLEIVTLSRLLTDMILHAHQVTALSLLSTAVAIWVSNLLTFSFVYWELDRGGPYGKTAGWHGRADFSFPRGDASDGFPEDWQPVFGDYLFLSFNTASAFSPTDTLPLTLRAKMFMMTQSAVSLITIVTIAARAINILGT